MDETLETSNTASLKTHAQMFCLPSQLIWDNFGSERFWFYYFLEEKSVPPSFLYFSLFFFSCSSSFWLIFPFFYFTYTWFSFFRYTNFFILIMNLKVSHSFSFSYYSSCSYSSLCLFLHLFPVMYSNFLNSYSPHALYTPFCSSLYQISTFLYFLFTILFFF